MSKHKRCKLCPHKRFCRDTCYGPNPCSIAKALDGTNYKIRCLQDNNSRLGDENKRLRDKLSSMSQDPDDIFADDFFDF